MTGTNSRMPLGGQRRVTRPLGVGVSQGLKPPRILVASERKRRGEGGSP